ncbi:MAG: hypothetical protein Q8R83_06030 [Legionellaceae bacterium]|nr:hypothetical protein [Legionellaceae bacterium]
MTQRRKSLGMMAAAFAIAMAGSLGSAQVAQTSQANPMQSSRGASMQEMKATTPTKSTRHRSVVAQAGGLDVIREGGVFGLTPMQYGMRFGNGKSRKGKTNMLRVSKNAKLRKRGGG